MNQIQLNVWFIINAVKKRFKLFLVIQAVIVISGAVYLFSLKNEYKAFATFFPLSAESSDPRVILYSEKDFSIFGYSDQVERFISYGKDRDILFYLNRKYNLAARWGIDTTQKKWQRTLIKIYNKKVDFEKGPHGSVDLTVYDTDPDTAVLIINDIIAQIENTVVNHTKRRNQFILDMYAASYQELGKYVQSLEDSLNKYAKNEAKYKYYERQLNHAYDVYMKSKLMYEQAKPLAENNLQVLQVSRKPEYPYQKARPKRAILLFSILVLGILVTSSVFAIIDWSRDNLSLKQ
jgi:hypothetical protein